MRAITAPKEIHDLSSKLKKEGRSIGLVPTMGALHDGHFALVERSLKENDVTIVSIFVNPLQFNKAEDLDNYPRSIEEDLNALQNLNVEYVFYPSAEELYEDTPAIRISFGEMSKQLEGAFRPGHFDGVGIVVSKLLNLTNPDKAYFGLKDLQQYLLIKRMVWDLSYQVQIVGVETVREDSGLALSSRNQRLSAEGKELASSIYKGLQKAKEMIEEGVTPGSVEKEVFLFYEKINGLDVEYLSVVNGSNLNPLTGYDSVSELAVCFAGYVEGIRLIDNLYLRLK